MPFLWLWPPRHAGALPGMRPRRLQRLNVGRWHSGRSSGQSCWAFSPWSLPRCYAAAPADESPPE